MKKIYLLAAVVAALFSTTTQAQVVISQAYGGGGNNGSVFLNDFIELYNRGTAAVNITGWSVQYASAAGAVISGRTDIPAVTLQPGQYYLIQQNGNATGTSAPLPTPDLIPTGNQFPDGQQISMSASNFKVMLVNSGTIVTSFTDPSIVDLLGVGTASAFEGTATAALTNGTAAIRNNAGCTDTNNNAADFTLDVPTPRNTASPVNVCNLATKDFGIAGLKVYPNPVKGGNLFITSDSNETKAVAIYNVLGKQVLTATVNDAPVNVSNLSAGVYIVKITEAGKTATKKLVIE